MIQDWLERLRAFWTASRRNQVFTVVSVAVLLTLIIVGVSLLANRNGETSARGAVQATATPVHRATTTPAGTPQPTAATGPTVTPLPTKPVNQAIIGGTEAAFTAKYGQPISTGVDSGNNLPTITYKGSKPLGNITIEMDSTHGYVVGVVISAPQNAPWFAPTVQDFYPTFAPGDATYDQSQTLTDQNNNTVALYALGHSQLLASSLPNGAFTDFQNQPILFGTYTFEIYYLSGTSGSQAYAVSFRLGNWPTSPAG
jgi:hypothetical protein